MTKQENSYKSIFKGTSIFGGSEFFKILINIVRAKFVAIILGPEGMGITSLLTSSTNILQQFSSLGLNLSIVREISSSGKNPNLLSKIIGISRKLLLFSGLFGAFLCFVLSPWLSKWSFGSNKYIIWFAVLSIMIFFACVSNGEMSILQGTHQVKKLAKSSIIGSLIGLFVGIPLYYIYGLNGIVPALVIMPITSYICYRFFLKAQQADSIRSISLRKENQVVRRMLVLGVTLMASNMLGSLAIYGVYVFIRHSGSVEDVGLYQAANSLTLQYMGVIISAMALDYFPRLSAIGENIPAMNDVVNKQTEVSLLIISPLAACLMVFAPLVVQIFLDAKFNPIVPLIQMMSISIILRTLLFPLAYISYSKGDKKTFFILEGIWANLLNFICPCVFYHYFGLIGLAYGQIANFTLVIIGYYIILPRIYHYSISKQVIILIVKCFMPIFLVLFFIMKLSYVPSILCSMPIIFILVFQSISKIKSLLHGEKQS